MNMKRKLDHQHLELWLQTSTTPKTKLNLTYTANPVTSSTPLTPCFNFTSKHSLPCFPNSPACRSSAAIFNKRGKSRKWKLSKTLQQWFGLENLLFGCLWFRWQRHGLATTSWTCVAVAVAAAAAVAVSIVFLNLPFPLCSCQPLKRLVNVCVCVFFFEF